MSDENDLTGVALWRCPNCGQNYFGDEDELPETCDFCNDYTTWQPVIMEQAIFEGKFERKKQDNWVQLPLFDDTSEG